MIGNEVPVAEGEADGLGEGGTDGARVGVWVGDAETDGPNVGG